MTGHARKRLLIVYTIEGRDSTRWRTTGTNQHKRKGYEAMLAEEIDKDDPERREREKERKERRQRDTKRVT